MIDREPRRSGAPDDQQALPHRGGTRRTEDPGRCSDAPSSPVSDAKYRQKTESVFAKTFKSLLQQNRSLADKPSRAEIERCPLLSKSGQKWVQSICPLSAISNQRAATTQTDYRAR